MLYDRNKQNIPDNMHEKTGMTFRLKVIKLSITSFVLDDPIIVILYF